MKKKKKREGKGGYSSVASCHGSEIRGERTALVIGIVLIGGETRIFAR